MNWDTVIFPNLGPFLQSQPVHSGDRRWSRIHVSQSPIDDHSSICRRIRIDYIGRLVFGSFQLVSLCSSGGYESVKSVRLLTDFCHL